MNKIGIDFGTTNSVLSYVEADRVESHRFTGQENHDYVPSYVAFDREDDAVLIGRAARNKLGDPDYQVYSRFKLLLAESDPQRLRDRGYNGRSPEDVAGVYLAQLVDAYLTDNRRNRVDGVVITVPKIWNHEGNQRAREKLLALCRKAGLPRPHIFNEPEAALVYFTRCYRKHEGRDFRGHVLVCDFGGGTLDLCLAQVEGHTVRVLEGTGRGNPGETLGAAGVAFDEAVSRRVLTEAKRREVLDDPAGFQHFARRFEEQKITEKTLKLDQQLKRFRSNPATNKKVFNVEGCEVTARHLVEEFDRLIAPELTGALEEIRCTFEQHGVDCDDLERFRVLLVGGFSNFYLVQDAIGRFFGVKSSTDSRFDNRCMSLNDTGLAISKGAAMIANEQAVVEQSCPISVGFQVMDPARNMERVDIEVLRKGHKAGGYRSPVYYPQPLGFKKGSRKAELTYFLDIGKGCRRYEKLSSHSLEDILPNQVEDNRWKIGFSLDEDMVFYLHVKDQKQGQQTKISLGDLEGKITGLVIDHD